MTTEFTAYQEAFDIIMINPSGFEMKRWSSRRSVSGWLGLEYPLSELPQLGRWTIRVKANGYSHDEHFYVKEYCKSTNNIIIAITIVHDKGQQRGGNRYLNVEKSANNNY